MKLLSAKAQKSHGSSLTLKILNFAKAKKANVGIMVFFILIFSAASLFAQAPSAESRAKQYLAVPSERGEVWISPSAEAALYSAFTYSYGPGFTVGYGKKASIGFKAAYFLDDDNKLDVLEFNLLLRYYLAGGAESSSGPFIQVAGGPALIFEKEKDFSMPIEYGMISAGLSFGWRFNIGKIFFIEPSIRGGYPFVAGASVASGFRF